jgi:hypothetical protein
MTSAAAEWRVSFASMLNIALLTAVCVLRGRNAAAIHQPPQLSWPPSIGGPSS